MTRFFPKSGLEYNVPSTGLPMIHMFVALSLMANDNFDDIERMLLSQRHEVKSYHAKVAVEGKGSLVGKYEFMFHEGCYYQSEPHIVKDSKTGKPIVTTSYTVANRDHTVFWAIAPRVVPKVNPKSDKWYSDMRIIDLRLLGLNGSKIASLVGNKDAFIINSRIMKCDKKSVVKSGNFTTLVYDREVGHTVKLSFEENGRITQIQSQSKDGAEAIQVMMEYGKVDHLSVPVKLDYKQLSKGVEVDRETVAVEWVSVNKPIPARQFTIDAFPLENGAVVSSNLKEHALKTVIKSGDKLVVKE